MSIWSLHNRCKLIGILITLATPAWSQVPLCDDSLPQQTWNNCSGSIVLNNGRRYEGFFKNGTPNGMGSVLLANGFSFIGQFQNGDYNGVGAVVDRNNRVIQAGVWRDGKFLETKPVDLAALRADLRGGLSGPLQTKPKTEEAVPIKAPSPPQGVTTGANMVIASSPPNIPDNSDANKQAPPVFSVPVAQSKPLANLQFANRRALVIGNDNYRFVEPLKNALADAKAMAAALQRSGYQVSLHLDLDEKRFKQALRAFRYEVQGGDEVMFFFAGHGVEIAGANFLLPVDIRVSGADSERDRDQLREDAVDLKRFMSDLEERKSKFALAVIDACREDPFPKEKGTRSISSRIGLAQTTPATGQMIIFSAGAGQLALDNLGTNDKSKNGVFTRVFLTEMEKPGIPVDRVLKNVRTEVSRLARIVGRVQTPAIYDQSEGDFYFRLN